MGVSPELTASALKSKSMPWFYICRNWSDLRWVPLLERNKEHRPCKGREPSKTEGLPHTHSACLFGNQILDFHPSLVRPLPGLPHLPNLQMFQGSVLNFPLLPKHISWLISFNLMASNILCLLKACNLYCRSAPLHFHTHIFPLVYLIRSSNLTCANWVPGQPYCQTCFLSQSSFL